MLNQQIASVLSLIKWPLALACAAFLPATAIALGEQVAGIARGMQFLGPFLGGAAAYLLLWWILLRRLSISFFSTLEHEFTHCLFAWLTLNRVTGLKATLRGGGTTYYRGTPNWLIQTGPYFFPTLSIALLAGLRLFPPQYQSLAYALLGASLVYHLISTWAEVHHRQTDLQEAGLLFSLLFLPTANLFFYALVIASLRFGFGGLPALVSALGHSPLNPLALLR